MAPNVLPTYVQHSTPISYPLPLQGMVLVYCTNFIYSFVLSNPANIRLE